MKAAKETYSIVAVHKLAAELQKRIDAEYQKAVDQIVEQWKTTD